MAGRPITFDAEAVLAVAGGIDSAATSFAVPAEPPPPGDRFAATAAAFDGTARARTQIADLAAALVALSHQIRTAAGQFAQTETVNTARLGPS